MRKHAKGDTAMKVEVITRVERYPQNMYNLTVGQAYTSFVGGMRWLVHDPDQNALIQLAKEAKRKGRITNDEADGLLQWANEYGVQPALDHRNTTHWVGGDHIRIGPVNHIGVR
jgi:hypothetical protein